MFEYQLLFQPRGTSMTGLMADISRSCCDIRMHRVALATGIRN